MESSIFNNTKLIVFRFSLLSLALLIALCIFEVYLRYFGSNRFDIAENISHSVFQTKERPLLGEKNKNTNRSLVHNGQLIFDEEIITDTFGRRITHPPFNSQQAFLFFGCSYTFGSALHQNETLPYLFSLHSQLDTYNYARPGAGPHVFLRQVQSLNLQEQISQTYSDIHLVYLFYDFQWRRALGRFSWVAKSGARHPYYVLDTDLKKAVYKGSFGQAHPLLSYFYFLIGKLHLTHYIPEKTGINNEEHVAFFCALFNESLVALENKFHNRLKTFTIVAPQFNDTAEETKHLLLKTQNCLQSPIQIKIISIKGNLENWVIDPLREFHPRADYNDLLGRELTRYFKK